MDRYTALTAMLGRVVDYAGTFPPARLSLEEALSVAARFRQTGRFPWLMKRVALTPDSAIRLSPSAFYMAGADGSAWEATIVGSEPGEEPLAAIGADLDAVVRVTERFQSSSMELYVTGYESKAFYEAVSAGDRKEIAAMAAELTALFEDSPGVTVYLEAPASEDSRDGLQALLSEARTRDLPIGVKVRTGGERMPAPGDLAATIALAAEAAVPFKATQGLHAPVSGDGSYGFVNLLAALHLAYGFPECRVSGVQRCLADSDPSAFRFEEGRFRWRDFESTADQIESSRRIHQGSFGSCSIEEPDQLLLEFLETYSDAREVKEE